MKRKNNGRAVSFPAAMSGKQVIIIGAGPAGLTAGYKLLQADKSFQVVILEESGCVGGISRTVEHNGNRMDLGGHRFFSKDPEVNAMWRELMPLQGGPALDDKILGREVSTMPGGPDPERTDRVMLSRNRVSRIYYGRHFFDYPVRINLNTIHDVALTGVERISVGALTHSFQIFDLGLDWLET